MKSYLLVTALVALPSLAVLGAGCASPTYAHRAGSAAAPDGPGLRAMVIVRVATPWYAPRFLVRSKFRDVLPEYESLAPLEAKYFTISDAGAFGGIYLWTTRADAEKHFDEAWRANVRQRRGVDADVLVMDALYVVQGRALANGEPRGARSVEYPAWASFVQWELPVGVEASASAKALAGASWSTELLMRGFVVTSPRTVGIVALWATREAAESAVTEDARRSLGAVAMAGASTFVLFEAPLLVDANLIDRASPRKPTATRPRRP